MDTAQLVETVKLAQAGNERARQELYVDASKNIYYLALKMLKNRDAAEDATQDIFITVFEKIHELREPAAYYRWLKTIAVHKCSNLLGKKTELLGAERDEAGQVELEEDDILALPDKAYDDAETRALIMEAVDGLPDAQRACIYSYYYQQLPVAEIARAVEANENTVKKRLALGREKVKQALLRKEREEGIKLYSAPLALTPILMKAMEEFAMPQGLAESMWRNIAQAAGIAIGGAAQSAAGGGAESVGAKGGDVSPKGPPGETGPPRADAQQIRQGGTQPPAEQAGQGGAQGQTPRAPANGQPPQTDYTPKGEAYMNGQNGNYGPQQPGQNPQGDNPYQQGQQPYQQPQQGYPQGRQPYNAQNNQWQQPQPGQYPQPSQYPQQGQAPQYPQGQFYQAQWQPQGQPQQGYPQGQPFNAAPQGVAGAPPAPPPMHIGAAQAVNVAGGVAAKAGMALGAKIAVAAASVVVVAGLAVGGVIFLPRMLSGDNATIPAQGVTDNAQSQDGMNDTQNTDGASAPVANAPIIWTDEVLERLARSYLERPSGDIMPQELAEITNFALRENGLELSGPVMQHIEETTDLPQDFSNLKDFPDLYALYIERPEVKWDTILKLSTITQLEIDDDVLQDVALIADMTNLTFLEIDFDEIQPLNLSLLSGFPKLEQLTLRGIGVTSLPSLSGLTKLRELDINTTLISDLSPLAEVPSLERITLYDTAVLDLNPLRNLPNLEYVWISEGMWRYSEPVSHIGEVRFLGGNNNSQIMQTMPGTNPYFTDVHRAWEGGTGHAAFRPTDEWHFTNERGWYYTLDGSSLPGGCYYVYNDSGYVGMSVSTQEFLGVPSITAEELKANFCGQLLKEDGEYPYIIGGDFRYELVSANEIFITLLPD